MAGFFPDVFGSTAGLLSQLRTGKTITVCDTYGDDSRASYNADDLSRPWKTIGAALAVAVSGDLVQVRPGTYAESVTIGAGVHLCGTAGDALAYVTGAAATGVRITMGAGAVVTCLKVTAPTDALPAILAAAGVGCEIHQVTFVGTGAAGHGVVTEGAGFVRVADCTMISGTIGSIVRMTGAAGIMTVDHLEALTGTATTVIDHAGTGTMHAHHVLAHLSFFTCTNGILVGASAVLKMTDIEIDGTCTNGLHITGDAVNIDASQFISSATAYDILVDGGLTTGTVVLTESRIRTDRISAPSAYWANFNYAASDLKSGDVGYVFSKQIAVGTQENGAESVFGGGDSHNVNFSAFTNDNLEVGSWVDVSAVLASSSGSTVAAFPGVTAGNTLYIGGDLTFPGVKTAATAAIVIGAGALIWEAWTGAAWDLLPICVVADTTETHYAQVWASAIEGQQVHFERPSGWATKALDGVTKYWIRVRIGTGITTSPTLEQVKLGTDRTEITENGTTNHYGQAQHELQLPGLTMESTLALSVGASGNETLDFSTNITLLALRNKLTNNQAQGFGGTFQVSHGLNTARAITLSTTWHPSTADTGNAELVLYWVCLNVGDALAGAGTPEGTQTIVVTPSAGVADQAYATDFTITIPDAVEGAIIAMALKRDAQAGNDPPDTFVGDVYFSSIVPKGYFWGT